MTTSHTPLSDLSDDDLLSEVKRLVAAERHATAALIQVLIELDVRKLYLRESCSSLFTYCTQVLHLAEGSAYNRIEAARAARRFPLIIDALRDGSVTLTTVRLLVPHLTDDNHEAVLASARHKAKRDIQLLVATLNPKPPVATIIRKVPDTRRDRVEDEQPLLVATSCATAAAPARAVDTAPTGNTATEPLQTRSLIAPLAPERFKLQCTITRDTHDKLRRVQDLLRHTILSGDLGEILDRAVTLLLDDLERRRCAMTAVPRVSRRSKHRSRYISAPVRRAVWKRDEGRCAFIGREGRCRETAFLEFHHVEPYALGGAATVETIQLRCRAHNLYEALLVFGEDVVRDAHLPWPCGEAYARRLKLRLKLGRREVPSKLRTSGGWRSGR